MNTARAVYGRLEEDGLIVSRHGLGTFVAEGAPPPPTWSASRPRPWTAPGRAASTLATWPGRSTRAPGRAPRLAPSGELPAEPPPAERLATDGDERLGRRELRRQIARLEAQLASYPAEARKPGEPTHPLLRPKEHVADMAELEATRDELIERLRQAREAAERRGEREGRARARLEEMVSDPAAHKWEKVSRRIWASPAARAWGCSLAGGRSGR